MNTKDRLIKIFAIFLAGVIIVNVIVFLFKLAVFFLPEDEKFKYMNKVITIYVKLW